MTVRLLLDEMYPPALAEILREQGHDVGAIAGMSELVGTDDATVLDVASADGRCVVTENVCDFAVLARHASHAGVLFAQSRRWPRTRQGLPRLATALHEAICSGRIPGPNEVRWLA